MSIYAYQDYPPGTLLVRSEAWYYRNPNSDRITLVYEVLEKTGGSPDTLVVQVKQIQEGWDQHLGQIREIYPELYQVISIREPGRFDLDI